MPSQKQGSWWGRNWKWFVPTGCLAFVVVAVGLFAALLTGVYGLMKSSDAYKIAVDTAKADSRVVAALGSPVQEGFFLSGNINLNNDSGKADLAIPISGPNGKGTIIVVATKTAGKWSFSKLVVQVRGRSESIDLNDKQKLDQK